MTMRGPSYVFLKVTASIVDIRPICIDGGPALQAPTNIPKYTACNAFPVARSIAIISQLVPNI